MGLASIFMERDGGPTAADLAILAAVCLAILGIVAGVCRARYRERRRVWAVRMADVEDKAAANSELLERLADEEERLGRVVGEIRHHITGAAADSRPRLRVVKSL